MAAATSAPTAKDYWEDTHRVRHGEAGADGEEVFPTILRVETLPEPEDDKKTGSDAPTHALILDRTLFHPQGGGQPSDTGTIHVRSTLLGSDSSNQDEILFHVSFVQANQQTGEIRHLGRFAAVDGSGETPGASPKANDSSAQVDAAAELPTSFEAGVVVACRVDVEKRLLHARLHSGGHLLDLAVRACGFDYLVPGKGYHFASGPYVEYSGAIPAGERPEAAGKIAAACAQLITENPDAAVEARIVPYGEIEGLCGSVPSYLPKEEPARIVRMHVKDPLSGETALGCPCGGTHVRKVGDIGAVTVRKITVRKGITRISYEVTSSTASS